MRVRRCRCGFVLLSPIHTKFDADYQWNSSSHGGFTTGKPWMRVNDDYPSWNAEKQILDPDSVRSFWKKLLVLRKEKPVLVRIVVFLQRR